jgi:acetyl esterase/lipase
MTVCTSGEGKARMGKVKAMPIQRALRLPVAGARLIVIVLLILEVAGCASSTGSTELDTPTVVPPPTSVQRGQVLAIKQLAPLAGARRLRLIYRTGDVGGHAVPASAEVVVPSVSGPYRGVVVWEHGTTGIGPGCAPSLVRHNVGDLVSPDISSGSIPFAYGMPALTELVSAGFVMLAPDGPGTGIVDPRGASYPSDYLIAQGEAADVVYAVRALESTGLVDEHTGVTEMGWSQGGHAALAAAGAWRNLGGREMPPLVGIVLFAPVTDLELSASTSSGSKLDLRYQLYLMRSYKEAYHVDVGAVLTAAGEHDVDQASHLCSRAFEAALAGTDPLMVFKENPALVMPWLSYLQQNSVSAVHLSVPAIVVQGLADSVVNPSVTISFTGAQCAAGGSVHLVLESTATHYLVPFTVPRGEIVRWVQRLTSTIPNWEGEKCAV